MIFSVLINTDKSKKSFKYPNESFNLLTIQIT